MHPSTPVRPVALLAFQPCPEPAPTGPPGFICEVCFDAPAVALQPAPGGGERGVCEVCGARRTPVATDAAPCEE